jgi:RND superfamily putative drug exporter
LCDTAAKERRPQEDRHVARNSTSRDAASKGEPWTVRIAVWSARHRWPVATGWFVLTLGLLIASIALGGQKAPSAADQGQIVGESQAGKNAFADAGKDPGSSSIRIEPVYLVVRNPSGPIDTAANRAVLSDMTARLQALTVIAAGKQTQVFYPDPASPVPAVVDPFVLARTAPDRAPSFLSADGTTAIIAASIAGDDDVCKAKASAIALLTGQFQARYPNLTIHAFNITMVNDDINDYVGKTLDGLLILTLIIAFVILLIASRSAIAAVVPIVVGLSAIAGGSGAVGLYSQVIAPVMPQTMVIPMLLGLAVGVDYSLFVISRFRSERAGGRDKIGSIEIASATAGRAVFFSGLAVIISLGSLLLIGQDFLTSMAVGCTAVVLISVLGSFTFLPAALAILDRKVMRFGIPYVSRERGEGRGVWAAVVRAATNRAVMAAVVAGGILIVMAVPVSRLALGSTISDLSAMPPSIEGAKAADLLSAEWPAGHTLTMDVVVTNATEPRTAAAIAAFADAMKTGVVGGVNAATTLTEYSADKTVAKISAAIPGSQNDQANWALVRTFRTAVVPRYFGSLPDAHVYVSGDAAYAMDYSESSGRQMPLVIIFVLTMSFLLLMVAFHSVVIPLKAILLNLLSAGAAFGVLVLLFQEGWLREFTGLRPNVIEAGAPLMIFTILFGLSMDYHVFILTRVKEARDRGLASTDAVVKGIAITAGTVTSAAAIMVSVFGSFFTIQMTVMQEFGIGLAVAIFVDATLVRSLLLPALMKLLGEWNWWMPRFLRWIPRITIEGEPEALLGDG